MSSVNYSLWGCRAGGAGRSPEVPRGAQLRAGCGEGRSLVLLIVVFPGIWEGIGIFVWFGIPVPSPKPAPWCGCRDLLCPLNKTWGRGWLLIQMWDPGWWPSTTAQIWQHLICRFLVKSPFFKYSMQGHVKSGVVTFALHFLPSIPPGKNRDCKIWGKYRLCPHRIF